MNNRSAYCTANERGDAKARFKKSLSKYLGFNLFIFIFMILGMGGSFLMKISVVWGAILALKWYRFDNQDHCSRKSTPDHDDDKRAKYGRPRRPEWKDKDLV